MSAVLDQLMDELVRRADPQVKEQLARFGIPNQKAWGIPMPQLHRLAQRYRYDHQLALALIAQEVHEAKILAALVCPARELSREEVEHFRQALYSWDLVDQFCGRVFQKTPYAWDLPGQWLPDQGEMLRRSGAVMIVALAVHHKNKADTDFLSFLSLLEPYLDDERNFVFKANSWALRSLGKRSLFLHQEVQDFAHHLVSLSSKQSQKLGKEVLRNINRSSVLQRLAKRDEH